MKIVLCTGGFDPLHSGHIKYFQAAKRLGSKLIVGLNSDEWLSRKKGRPFMNWNERASIIRELRIVDDVIAFDDSDNSACNAIYKCITKWPDYKLVFANGGDRTNNTTPEFETYSKTPWVEFAFGVGGENKINSSSWILDNWRTQKTERPWGYWRVLDDKGVIKVKELVINPGCTLSNQRHNYRSEHWYVLKGECVIETDLNNLKYSVTVKANNSYVIGNKVWHRAYNTSTEPCYILETQYGDKCIEEDIERLDE